MIQELRLLFECLSRICCRCANCAGEGTWGGWVGGVPGGPCGPVGKDCLLLRRRAGDKLYFTLACTKSSLNI